MVLHDDKLIIENSYVIHFTGFLRNVFLNNFVYRKGKEREEKSGREREKEKIRKKKEEIQAHITLIK